MSGRARSFHLILQGWLYIILNGFMASSLYTSNCRGLTINSDCCFMSLTKRWRQAWHWMAQPASSTDQHLPCYSFALSNVKLLMPVPSLSCVVDTKLSEPTTLSSTGLWIYCEYPLPSGETTADNESRPCPFCRRGGVGA